LILRIFTFPVYPDDEKETSIHSQTVDFGSEQGMSDFETTDIAGLFRGFKKSENAALGQKMPFVNGYLIVRQRRMHLNNRFSADLDSALFGPAGL